MEESISITSSLIKKKASLYEVGDRVLVFHRGNWYEAKVLNIFISEIDGERRFLVHYNGWNDRYNEEIKEERISVFDPLKLRPKKKKNHSIRKREINNNTTTTTTPTTTINTTHDLTPPSVPNIPKKRRRVGAIESQVRVNIPFELKRRLVEDRMNIEQQHSLVPLPRIPSVATVFQEFLKQRSQQPGVRTIQEVEEICDNLLSYFDKCLGLFLLYKMERTQYGHILKDYPDKAPSEIYGAEHLLRLLAVSLPSIVSGVEIETNVLRLLKVTAQEVIDFLHHNSANLFVEDYLPASPSYLRLSGTT